MHSIKKISSWFTEQCINLYEIKLTSIMYALFKGLKKRIVQLSILVKFSDYSSLKMFLEIQYI